MGRGGGKIFLISDFKNLIEFSSNIFLRGFIFNSIVYCSKAKKYFLSSLDHIHSVPETFAVSTI